MGRLGPKVSAVARSVPSMTTADLLDEIAACERRVRGLQARQLALLAEYADAGRDGPRPGECELTERMVAMEAAAAPGVLDHVGADAGRRRRVPRRPASRRPRGPGRGPGRPVRRPPGRRRDRSRRPRPPDPRRRRRAGRGGRAAAARPGQDGRRRPALRPRPRRRRPPRRPGPGPPRRLGRAQARRGRDLGATLPAEQALACWAALDSHARGRRADGDDRPIAQIMSDTLVERVTGAARADARRRGRAAGRDHRPEPPRVVDRAGRARGLRPDPRPHGRSGCRPRRRPGSDGC